MRLSSAIQFFTELWAGLDPRSFAIGMGAGVVCFGLATLSAYGVVEWFRSWRR